MAMTVGFGLCGVAGTEADTGNISGALADSAAFRLAVRPSSRNSTGGNSSPDVDGQMDFRSSNGRKLVARPLLGYFAGFGSIRLASNFPA